MAKKIEMEWIIDDSRAMELLGLKSYRTADRLTFEHMIAKGDLAPVGSYDTRRGLGTVRSFRERDVTELAKRLKDPPLVKDEKPAPVGTTIAVQTEMSSDIREMKQTYLTNLEKGVAGDLIDSARWAPEIERLREELRRDREMVVKRLEHEAATEAALRKGGIG